MPPTTALVDHLNRLLDIDAFGDYGPNGLQVPGPAETATVVTGVSAHADLLERAAAEGADLVLVHHGLFWRGQPLEITAAMHRRLKLLYGHEMALAAYHLPLDAHPELGNNALLARGLGLTDLAPFAVNATPPAQPIGVHGRLPGDGIDLEALTVQVQALVGGRAPIVVAAPSGRSVRTLGIVSGGGTDFLADAVALGLDAFLTGEPAERAYGMARDNDIHFLAAGHHATETLGIRALGDELARAFGVRHAFVDVPNPI